jgi:hypothetical protein
MNDKDKLLTRQLNITSCHPRLSGIRQRNKLNSKKDSGQAGMTEFEYLLAGLINPAITKSNALSACHC